MDTQLFMGKGDSLSMVRTKEDSPLKPTRVPLDVSVQSVHVVMGTPVAVVMCPIISVGVASSLSDCEW